MREQRLAIVDLRPAEHAQRVQGAGGVAGWLRARYADPAAWREAGYACLLATVMPALSAAALVTLTVAGSMLASPLIIGLGGVAVSVPPGGPRPCRSRCRSSSRASLLTPWSYLVTLAAGADAAVTRSLLSSGEPEERLRAELTEVAASRARQANAFDAERRRIERDLHDGAQQKLVALTMQLGLARLDIPPRSSAEQAVTATHEQAKQLMADLRDLIHGIQPQILTDLGLPREGLSGLLQRFGFHVVAMAGDAGGLHAAAEHEPDLVITDIRMPYGRRPASDQPARTAPP
jgi:signal transduction histidine kinase